VILLPPPGERLLPALTGALLVLCFPPFHLLLPPFCALVPLLVHVAERRPGAAERWTATRGGFLAGTIYFGLLLYWMVSALLFYTVLAVPGYLLTVLILAGFVGAFAALLHLVHERLPLVPLALAAAALWTALEWLQGHLGPLSFPWLGLGMSLTGFPRLASAADLVGSRGLGFLLVLVNGLIAETVLRFRAGSVHRRALLPPAAAAAAIALGLLGYGAWRMATLELVPASRVAVVQPNIPEEMKLDPDVALDTSLKALTALTRRIERDAVDLVVWPEVAVPALISHWHYAQLQDTVRALSVHAGAPILVGAYGHEGEPWDRATFFNSAFVVAAEGFTEAPYHKQHLVPFVERVPFIDPGLLRRFTGELRYFGGLSAGRGGPVLGPDGSRYGVLICYESIFAEVSRRYRRDGADFLVNITNDAWYGREQWYTRTTALWQHPAHMTMRAIENRVGVARAANTGISLYVDPLGRNYERTPLFVADVRTAPVLTTRVDTLYVRWGDWLARLAVALAAALVAGALVLGRRAV
jgi:apolipoprotein N-acyltransferase